MDKIKSLADLRNIKENLQKQASLNSPDTALIRVGYATSGIASGAKEVMNFLVEECGKRNVKATITQVGDMGYCYAEPTIEVTLPGKEPVVFGYVDVAKADEIIEKYVKKGEMLDGVVPVDYLTIDEDVTNLQDKKQIRIALKNCGFLDPEKIEDSIARDAYAALGKVLTEMKPQECIDLMKKSGLRGRGGGGFPTGLKWELAAKTQAFPKYVICNADEGDPGAFMDRSVLEGDPHATLEAMAICGYCIGANKGLIYIRAEYPLAIKRLKIAIEQATEAGLLGKNIFGTGFDFEI